MSIDNYTDLQAALQLWQNRTDGPVTDFIGLAEARIRRDLRISGTESDIVLTTTVGSRYLALPASYWSPRQLWIVWTNGREELDYIVPSGMRASTTQGRPYFWCIDGFQLALDRPSDQPYTLNMRVESFAGLSNANPINFVLATHPDLYLFAALIEFAVWLKDDADAQRWNGKYQEALASAQAHENRPDSMAALRVDPALRRPRLFNIYSGDYL